MDQIVVIVGGGLAGCEAAYQVAERGLEVMLYEMRPCVNTPAHTSGRLAELVCSSSLKSSSPNTAHGLLKQEMRKLGSLVLGCADIAAVPGGDALCVDREVFANEVTQRILSHPRIQVVREEVSNIPSERPAIIAAGPLASSALCASIQSVVGVQSLHFFDAIAPSVAADSINDDLVFRQSRYDKGEAAYLNCPMTRDEYYTFVDALVAAEITELHLEEERVATYFEGCLPVEVMAKRGRETLAHGNMKPVGLADPRTGRRPYAVVQLRQENREGTIYGLVGFQTQLRRCEQERVFCLIPGLENALFVRYGAVHRNTFINAPEVLNPTLQTKFSPQLFFAGQIAGVEGYMESAATGIIAGINAARVATGLEPVIPPRQTMIGSLLDYISFCPSDRFQPMNSNFGILPDPDIPHHKRDRKLLKIEQAITAIDEFAALLG